MTIKKKIEETEEVVAEEAVSQEEFDCSKRISQSIRR